MIKDKDYYDKLFFGAKVSTFNNAGYLRKNETKAERILWNKLRNRKLSGFKFRRQHPIAGCVADFYCAEKKLIIELDGEIHNDIDRKINDESRTKLLNVHKTVVLRFRNDEIYNQLDIVLNKILEVIKNL
ncbi:MAG TPA: DUF559 domain-containing protein [Ignavibacteria bacterium]|nr:DUF559 domain-containing protein [Ignavibacteria bacterium]